MKKSIAAAHRAKHRQRPASERILNARPSLVRLLRIHDALKERRTPSPTTKSLGEELAVSSKTIQRHLKYMKEALKLPVAYDDVERGFFYDGEVGAFPLVEFTDEELLAMMVAQRAVESYKGTAFGALLNTTLERLTNLVTDVVSFRSSEVDGAFSFRGTGQAIPDEKALKLTKELSKAILDCLEISFFYQKPGEPEPMKRKARPYHLFSYNGLYYLVAFDLTRQAMRTFALPRMSTLYVTSRVFERDASFKPEKYFGDSFGMLRGEDGAKPKRVRIRFNDYAAQLVRERFWHESQVLRELPNGELEIELHVANLDEIKRWVLKFCGDAQAIEPPELVAAIREDAKRIAKAHA